MNPRNPVTWIVLATVCIVISAAAFGIEKVVRAANDAHRAVCAIKASDQRQYDTTRRYLHEHPDLIKKLGLSKAEIVAGQTQLRAELRVLKGVTCS